MPPSPRTLPRSWCVINELHIKPGDGDTGGEFVELRNLTGAAVDLGGWKLKRAVGFTFPAGTTLAPNGFVVVAENRAALLAAASTLDPAVVFGNFSGSLGNTRDLVRLTRPMTYLNARRSRPAGGRRHGD